MIPTAWNTSKSMVVLTPAGGVTWITPVAGLVAAPPAMLHPRLVLMFLSTLPGVVPSRVAAVQVTPRVSTLLAMASPAVLTSASPAAQQVTPASTAARVRR
ncbi:MAG TPA: hypothetical protein VMW49_02690 [Candidatus Dormibacteraeota bacterium]|nr:hypothetical protein [Candidatus Dormibacteraeota bacterium]